MTFLLSNWKILSAFAFIMALSLGAYKHGVDTTTTKYELQITQYKESINDQVQEAKNEKARIEAEQRAKSDKAALDYADTSKRLGDALKRLRDAQIMSGHCTLPVAGNSANTMPGAPENPTGIIDPIEVAAGIGQTAFYAMSMQDTLQCSSLIALIKSTQR